MAEVGRFHTAAAAATIASAAAWFTDALRSPGSVKYNGCVVYQTTGLPAGPVKYGGPVTQRGPLAIAASEPNSRASGIRSAEILTARVTRLTLARCIVFLNPASQRPYHRRIRRAIRCDCCGVLRLLGTRQNRGRMRRI